VKPKKAYGRKTLTGESFRDSPWVCRHLDKTGISLCQNGEGDKLVAMDHPLGPADLANIHPDLPSFLVHVEHNFLILVGWHIKDIWPNLHGRDRVTINRCVAEIK